MLKVLRFVLVYSSVTKNRFIIYNKTPTASVKVFIIKIYKYKVFIIKSSRGILAVYYLQINYISRSFLLCRSLKQFFFMEESVMFSVCDAVKWLYSVPHPSQSHTDQQKKTEI